MLEEPTKLSLWERDRIRQSFDVWLARRARRFHCEPAQVIAVINESMGGVGERHSREQITATEAPPIDTKSRPLGTTALITPADAGTTSPAGVEGDEDRPLDPPPVAPEVAVGRARKPSPDGAEPVRQAGGDTNEGGLALKDRILALRREHPDWTASMAAEHLDAKLSSVTAYGSLLGFHWPTRAEYERAQRGEKAFMGEAALRQSYADVRKRLGAPS